MNACKSCGESTKYECISCSENVCLRLKCSVAETKEYVPGWQEFKSVAYCMSCKPEVEPEVQDIGDKDGDRKESKCSSSLTASTSESSCSTSPFSVNENDETETDDETSESDSDIVAHSRNKHAVQPKPRKKIGRKAMWADNQITDMVDMIVNDDELVRKLIFTNVKKRKNSDAYQKILPKLNQKYQDAFGKDFPFTVKQMRNKFKWCISTCKKICLTIKTASGVKRFVDSKGYGNWFNALYPLVKTRDSCKPENATEPSAKLGEDKDSESEDFASKFEADKEMFVPVKKILQSDPNLMLLPVHLNYCKIQLRMIQLKNYCKFSKMTCSIQENKK